MARSILQCLFCSSKLNYKEFAVNTEILTFCEKCQIGYTRAKKNRSIQEKEVMRFYGEDYIKHYLTREKELRKQFDRGIEILKKYFREASILDIGCGIGFFLRLLEEDTRENGNTWHLYGIEPNKDLFRYSKKFCRKSRIVNRLIEETELKPFFFNCVTFWDVLEHIPNPLQALKEVNRILKNDGIVIVQAPNYKSLMAYLTKEKWDWWAPPDHLYHFSPRSLRLLLEKSGFTIYELKTYESKEIFIKNISGIIEGSSLTARILRKFLTIFFTVIYPFLSVVTQKLKIGGLLFVVAQKV